MIVGLIMFSHVSVCYAQFPYFQSDARSQAMAGTHVTQTNQWAGTGNPCGLAGINKASLGIYYANYFQVSELGMGSLYGYIPTRSGNFGFSFVSSGYTLLRQNMTTLAYGKKLGKNISAGIGLHYVRIVQPAGYPNLYALVPSMGFQFLVARGLVAGVSLFNPLRQEYYPSGFSAIPLEFCAGASYSPDKAILFCVDAVQISGEKMKFKTGTEIALNKILMIRLGLSTGRWPEISFGIGCLHRQMNLDLAVTRHPVLGFSPAAGLSYAFK